MPNRPPKPNDAIVELRRTRLRQWIDERFNGVQTAFIASTNDGEKQINQGELSALLRDKSFGEKRARSLELQAHMPVGYLDGRNALTPEGGYGVREHEVEYEARKPAPAPAPLPIKAKSDWPFAASLLKRIGRLKKQLPDQAADAMQEFERHLDILVTKWEQDANSYKSPARR